MQTDPNWRTTPGLTATEAAALPCGSIAAIGPVKSLKDTWDPFHSRIGEVDVRLICHVRPAGAEIPRGVKSVKVRGDGCIVIQAYLPLNPISETPGK